MFAYFIIVCIIIAVAALIHHVCLFSPRLLAISNVFAGIALMAAYHGAFTVTDILLGAGLGLVAAICYASLKNVFGKE